MVHSISHQKISVFDQAHRNLLLKQLLRNRKEYDAGEEATEWEY